LRSEVSVKFELEDGDETVYKGRIDVLIVQENLWVILVEAKRTSFNMTLALPQALTYLAMARPSMPRYAWVSNGEYSMFVKLDRGEYAFSDDFSLNRRQNELYDVLQILDRLKG
jgi:predicted type IV restriction endonuclease